MARIAVLFALALLVGCGPVPNEENGFGRIGRVDSDDPTIGTDDPDGGGGDETTDPGDEPDPPGDDDDDDDAWDAGEPEVADGTVVTFDVQCGLLDGVPRKRWMKTGPYWEEVRSDDPEASGTPWPDLEVCFGEGGKMLRWDDDGAIYIEAGGMGHDVTPTATEGLWLGGVYPLERSTPACDEALAARGLSWPINFGLTLVSIAPPT